MVRSIKTNFVRKLNQIFFNKTRVQLGQIHMAILQRDVRKKKISEYEVKVYSQWGEDGIIDYLVRRLNIKYPKILEIGIGDFEECNSRFLMENHLARVVVVDKNKEAFKTIMNYPDRWKYSIQFINKYVEVENTYEIYSNFVNDNGEIDILSIDIDGVDYWVLQEIPKENISIIICEYNSIFGHKVGVSIPNIKNFDRTLHSKSGKYFGASIKAFVDYLDKMNFVFIGTNHSCVNAFFVRKDLISYLNIDIPNVNDLAPFVYNVTGDYQFNPVFSKIAHTSAMQEMLDKKIIKTENNEEVYFRNVL